MKLLVLSDLHIEISPWSIPSDSLALADVIILAGDIGLGQKTIPWIKENCLDKPVLWVWGNHEYWNGHFPKTRLKIQKQLPADSTIRILENSSFVLNGVRFLGCTLWTDCRVHEGSLGVYGVMQQVARNMRDYQKIRAGTGYRPWRLSESIGEHLQSVRWLKDQLSETHERPTVVITHHAPLRECLNSGVDDRELDAAYASDLSGLIREYKPDIWIYGHTHKTEDFMYADTRIVSNPLGYYAYGEITGFNSGLIIEI